MTTYTPEQLRPCICGALWGLDLALHNEVRCLCGDTLHTFPAGGECWYVQHGPNPEHRSPTYEDGGLLAVCDWVDSVCLREGGLIGD